MTITVSQLRAIADSGGSVVTGRGDKIGSIGQIYLDDSTGKPEWVTVKTGVLGISESFVPLDGATLSGGDIAVPYDKATVKNAPRVDPEGSLSPEEEDHLYSYYDDIGGGYTTTDTDHVEAGTTADPTSGSRSSLEISEEEHEVVLHEERPVGEEAVPVERIRLDTDTVTDDVTVSEEVRKEKVDTDV